MPEDDYGPVPETKGWRRLKEWLDAEKGRTPTSLARALGIKQPSARAWLKRRARPAGALLEAVCVLTGAVPTDWETTEEQQERAKLLKRVANLPEAAVAPAPPFQVGDPPPVGETNAP